MYGTFPQVLQAPNMNPSAAPFTPGSYRPSATSSPAAAPSSKPNINAAPFTPGSYKPAQPAAKQQQSPAPVYTAPPPPLPPAHPKQPPQYTGSPYMNSAPPPTFKPSPLQPPRYAPIPAYGINQQPGLWLPPQAPGAHLPKGFCVQLLGCRGCGKTTQSKLLAAKYNLLHISGGAIREAGKWPHLELPIILAKYFGPNAEEPNKYNGVVLDRLVALHETDALYVENILRGFGMHLSVTFHLDVTPEIGHARAEGRKDGKDSSERLRTLEYRVQFSVANNMYAPQGTLSNVCAEDFGVDVVNRTLVMEVEKFALARNPPKPLPVPHHPHTQGYAKQVTNFDLFFRVRQHLLAALNNGKSEGVPLRFPGSQMAGVVDDKSFSNTRNITAIYSTYATLKADGQRILICKCKEGIFGFNNVFHYMYDFEPYMKHFKISLPNITHTKETEGDEFDFVLDCELFTDGINPKIAVFDFLILGTAHGKEVPFDKRLEMMTALLPEYTPTAPFFLKEYVPAGELHSLLADFNAPPYPIDGVVFQHKGVYCMGRDRFIQKWKPEHMCTVDFRLVKAVPPVAGSVEWVFDANVGSVTTAHEEETIAKTCVIVHSKDVEALSICDGTIAECRKRRAAHPRLGADVVVWDFVRARPDKSGPNRRDVYDSVNSMNHLSYEQLASKLEHIHSKRSGGSK